jgi:hypothetical protein
MKLEAHTANTRHDVVFEVKERILGSGDPGIADAEDHRHPPTLPPMRLERGATDAKNCP